jgi:hypothetical protein
LRARAIAAVAARIGRLPISLAQSQQNLVGDLFDNALDGCLIVHFSGQ